MQKGGNKRYYFYDPKVMEYGVQLTFGYIGFQIKQTRQFSEQLKVDFKRMSGSGCR